MATRTRRVAVQQEAPTKVEWMSTQELETISRELHKAGVTVEAFLDSIAQDDYEVEGKRVYASKLAGIYHSQERMGSILTRIKGLKA